MERGSLGAGSAVTGLVAGACGVALLADAAFETTRAGSPARWWAIAALAVEIVAAAILWRRRGSLRAQVAVALTTLLALAAVSAWLPGGLMNGLAMFGQATPRLLAVLAAVGVLLAGMALIRAPRLPLAARYALGALAVYGVAAFLAGAVAAVPMNALLHGQSLWTVLPFVLQGAFVGGLVVLPLGLAATILSGGFRRPQNEPGRDSAYQIVAIVASLATILAGVPFAKSSAVAVGGMSASSGLSTAPTGSAAAASGAPATAVPSPLEDMLAAVERQPALSASERDAVLAGSFRAMQDGEREAPRDRWDVNYVTDRLGNDSQRTFAWVRAHTYWVPYRGLLRGPVGVLMDRQGSSLDRAELLAVLLHGERRQVRLAHATLTSDQAVNLLPRLLVAAMRSMPRSAATPQGDPWGVIAGKYQLNEASLRATISAQTESRARLRNDLKARVQNQSQRLYDAIGGPELAKDSAGAELASAIEALRDHWWVQTLDQDTWRDLDLLSRDGRAIATADRTTDSEEVPADERQQIVIRVIGEQMVDGALKERLALEHALRPSDLIGTAIAVRFAPGDWPKPFPQPGMSLPQSFRATVLAQHSWTPVLVVGKEHITQTALDDAGNLTMPTGYQDTVSMAKGVARGLGPALDGIFSAPEPAKPNAAPSAPGSFLTAAWIEYELDAPGQPPRKIRRALFDLLGASARARKALTAPRLDQEMVLGRSFALMTETEILPTVSRLSPQFVTHLAAQALLANRDVITSIVRGEVPDDFAHACDIAAKMAPVPSSLYDLALTRLLWSPMSGFEFVNQPNILTRHTFFVPSGQGFDLRIATDIVSNDLGVIPVVSPFLARLVQGVYDTNLESRLITGRPDASNTAWAFDAGQWTGVTSSADTRLGSLRLSDDVRQHIGDSLAGGAVVVAPDAPVTVMGRAFSGWWQIDRRTGQTLGLDARGWGSSMPDYGMLLLRIALGSAMGFAFAYVLCVASSGNGSGPSARACEPETPGKWIDYLVTPVHALTACMWHALPSMIFGGVAAGLGAGGGGGGGEPGGGGGGGGNGGGNGAGGSGGGAGSNDPVEEALQAADQRFWQASQRGDMEGQIQAIRDMARANPSTPNPELIPPPGAPSNYNKVEWPADVPSPGTVNPVNGNGPAPVLNPISDKAQSIVGVGNGVDPLGKTEPGPCPPTCSPFDNSVGGFGGVTQVLGGGGQ